MAQKEASAVAVGGNNDEIIALDGTDNIKDRIYEDHPHHNSLSLALKSKKYAPLQRKRELVLLFRPSELDDAAVDRYCRDQNLYIRLRHLLDDIGRNTVNRNQISKNLTQAYTAEMLADLFVLNEWNSQLVDNRRPSRSDPSVMVKKAFASLSELVDTVLVAYSDDQKKNEKKKGGRSKVNLQQTGTRIQDTYPFDPLNDVSTEACPACRHYYCLQVTKDDEIKAQQDEIDAKFNRKMVEWNAKPGPASTKGGKPRRQKSVCHQLACFCYKIHCSYRLDGGNCPACRAAATVGESMVSIGGDGKAQCSCEICSCKCEIKFGLHERRNIAFRIEHDKWMGTTATATTPTNTPSFFASVIQGTLQQEAIDASQDPSSNDPTMMHQNAISLAAGSIFGIPGSMMIQPLMLPMFRSSQLSLLSTHHHASTYAPSMTIDAS